MSKVAFSFLWCFVFFLPWDEVIHLPVWGSLPRVVGVVASVAGVLHIVARGRIRPPSWFNVLGLLFVLWAGASSFWSIDPDATRGRFLSYLQLLVLAWLIWEIAWSAERQRALLRAYVLGAGVAAVAIGYSYLSGVSLDAPTERFTALNANPNELGLTLVLGLPMAWHLSLSEPRRHLAWAWQLYLPLGLPAILLTASRGAFVAALVAVLIIPWTLGHVRVRTGVALCSIALGVLALANRFVPQASLERIASTPSDIQAGYFGGRGVIWKSGLEVVRAHPLAGVGAGAFGAAVEPTLRDRWSSHQTFLAILAEQGVIGLLLFLAMMAAALTPVRHLSALERRFSIVLLGALTVGSFSGAWDYRKQLWFVLGLLAAQVTLRGAPRAASQMTRRLVALAQ